MSKEGKSSDQETLNKSSGEQSVESNIQIKSTSDELVFNARAMSSSSEEFIKSLAKANSSIQKTLDNFEQCLIKQEQNVTKINTESGVLCLIPEKMEERINGIIPKVAAEVELIYNSKSMELNKQFDALQDKLTKNFNGYEQTIAATTKQSLEQLTNTIESMKISLEQKLTEFSKQLAEEADAVSSQKSMRFLKNLAFILLFSGLVSAFSSYLVATQFPRYVRVDNPDNLSINDSKIEIWGAKLNELKGSQSDKKKK